MPGGPPLCAQPPRSVAAAGCGQPGEAGECPHVPFGRLPLWCEGGECRPPPRTRGTAGTCPRLSRPPGPQPPAMTEFAPFIPPTKAPEDGRTSRLPPPKPGTHLDTVSNQRKDYLNKPYNLETLFWRKACSALYLVDFISALPNGTCWAPRLTDASGFQSSRLHLPIHAHPLSKSFRSCVLPTCGCARRGVSGQQRARRL